MKLSDRPFDEGYLLKEVYFKYEHIEGVYEAWSYSGVYGESVIFLSKDVCHMDDLTLWTWLCAILKQSSDRRHTISHKTGFTYINFNFEVR